MGIGNSEALICLWRKLNAQRWLEAKAAAKALKIATIAIAICGAALGALTPASADWREDIGTFRVGIVAEPGAGNTVAGLAELSDAYTKALGLKVEFFVAENYAALVDAQAAARIEYAIYSATAYAAAFQRCECVEPLVAPVDGDGSIGIRSVLITRDGRLSSVADMKTHRIAFMPPDSVAGHQLPMSELSLAGGRLTGAEPFLVQASSALAAETMLVDGSVDAIFGWTPAAAAGMPAIDGGTMARLEAVGIERSALTIVWQSDVLRYGPHAVLNSLDPEPKRRLAVFLKGLRETEPELYERLESHHLGGFTAASQTDYAAALAIVRMLAERRIQQ